MALFYINTFLRNKRYNIVEQPHAVVRLRAQRNGILDSRAPANRRKALVVGIGREAVAVNAMHGGAVVAVEIGDDVLAARGFAAVRYPVRQVAQSHNDRFGHGFGGGQRYAPVERVVGVVAPVGDALNDMLHGDVAAAQRG